MDKGQSSQYELMASNVTAFPQHVLNFCNIFEIPLYQKRKNSSCGQKKCHSHGQTSKIHYTKCIFSQRNRKYG